MNQKLTNENVNEAILALIQDVEHADLDAELAHYGIKGMQWGVRRKDYVKKTTSGSKSSSGSSSKGGNNVNPSGGAKKPATSERKTGLIVSKTPAQKKIDGSPQKPVVTAKINNVDLGKKTTPSPRNPRSLSDADLSAALRRLQMEKQYKELSAPEISAGRKIATDILVGAGKQVAIAYAVHYLGKGAAKVTKVDLGIKPAKDKKDKD